LNECEGDITDCWQNENSLWGNVLRKCGYPNTDKARKALYMMWRKNWGCIREKYQECLESTKKLDANNKVNTIFVEDCLHRLPIQIHVKIKITKINSQ
jgi:hypothetical protein